MKKPQIIEIILRGHMAGHIATSRAVELIIDECDSLERVVSAPQASQPRAGEADLGPVSAPCARLTELWARYVLIRDLREALENVASDEKPYDLGVASQQRLNQASRDFWEEYKKQLRAESNRAPVGAQGDEAAR